MADGLYGPNGMEDACSCNLGVMFFRAQRIIAILRLTGFVALLGEIWRGYRPHFVKLAVDFLVSATFWVGLFLFHLLTKLLPVTDWAGKLIANIHSTGVIAGLVVFGWLSLNDIYQIHKSSAPCLV